MVLSEISEPTHTAAETGVQVLWEQARDARALMALEDSMSLDDLRRRQTSFSELLLRHLVTGSLRTCCIHTFLHPPPPPAIIRRTLPVTVHPKCPAEEHKHRENSDFLFWKMILATETLVCLSELDFRSLAGVVDDRHIPRSRSQTLGLYHP